MKGTESPILLYLFTNIKRKYMGGCTHSPFRYVSQLVHIQAIHPTQEIVVCVISFDQP